MDASSLSAQSPFPFIEANARLQDADADAGEEGRTEEEKGAPVRGTTRGGPYLRRRILSRQQREGKAARTEERRAGQEGRARWAPDE